MNWIILEGVQPWDGRYELDLAGVEFTTREMGWLKRLAGIQPNDLEAAFRAIDAELFAVLGVIALRRAGRIETRDVPDVYDKLIDGPFMTAIRIEGDQAENDEEEDADPQASSPAKPASSGTASTTSSETSQHPRNGSGTPDSDTSTWHPARSGS